MEMYGNQDDDEAGSRGGISSSTSSSTTFSCMSEVDACVADTESGGCFDCMVDGPSNNSGYVDDVSSCSAVVSLLPMITCFIFIYNLL